MFSVGVERDQWNEMGEVVLNLIIMVNFVLC